MLRLETATASWVQATYITPDTSFLDARASEKALAFTSRAIAESARYLGQELDPDTARQLMLLRFGAAMPAPDDPDKRAELSTEMEAMYGSARYCPASGECLAETYIIRLMADERKYKKNKRHIVEKNFFPKSRCSAGINRWMAAGFAEIALALAKLPIFCGRLQTATHRNLYQSGAAVSRS